MSAYLFRHPKSMLSLAVALCCGMVVSPWLAFLDSGLAEGAVLVGVYMTLGYSWQQRWTPILIPVALGYGFAWTGCVLLLLSLFAVLDVGCWVCLRDGVHGCVNVCRRRHFFFEQNQPATFVYPSYSLASDYKLMVYTIAMKIPY